MRTHSEAHEVIALIKQCRQIVFLLKLSVSFEVFIFFRFLFHLVFATHSDGETVLPLMNSEPYDKKGFK